MLKKLKSLIIGLLAFVGAIAITAIALYGVSLKAVDDEKPTDFLSVWMSTIKDDALLTDIVIPGSHDAGSLGMMWAAETQDKSIYDQLTCGTRYFDLRVTIEKDTLTIYHGPIKGQTFEIVIDDIVKFISQHDSEVLLLDFQHFENGANERVFEMLQEKLGDKIVSYNDTTPQNFIDNLTLKDVRGKCIIFWGSEQLPNGGENKVFVRDADLDVRENSVLHSPYTRENNVKLSSKYIEESIPDYIEKLKEHKGGFCVLQGQLTDPVFIVGPKVLEATHSENMSNYVRSLERSEDLEYINIIMRDYVGAMKNTEIIALNLAKDTVKDKSALMLGILPVLDESN